jgi:Tyrosine phosphatase family
MGGAILVCSIHLVVGCCTGVPANSGPTPAAAAAPQTQIKRLGQVVGPLLRGAGVDPDKVYCNTHVHWQRSLNRYAKEIIAGVESQWKVQIDEDARKRAVHHALGYLVRSYFDQAQPHNMGVMELKGRSWRDDKGRSGRLLVFRSGLTIDDGVPPGPSKCFESLLHSGGVRHVVNLYGGSFPFHDVVAAEQRSALALGFSYVDAAKVPALQFRKLVEREQDYAKNQPEAMRRLATLLRRHLLRPGGASPRGNLYVHCGGGMHRTGMVIGVLRRCINKDSMLVIEAEYRRHTSWHSTKEPGGFEALNLRFIRDFDCSLLSPKGK